MLARSLLVGALAFVSAAAFASPEYYVVVPLKGKAGAANDISVSLGAYALPGGHVGAAYPDFDLKALLSVVGDPGYTGYGVKWALVSGSLPAGLTLNANGTISGTPTAEASSSFQVKATYKTKSGQQAYQILVTTLEVTVALSETALPDALVRKAYAYDLKPLLKVTGDPNFKPGEATFAPLADFPLPPGLSLSADGVISGTATTAVNWSVTAGVTATYKNKSAEQYYELKVSGVPLSVTSIAAGDNHTCAITAGGGVKCWGLNARGQLGNNSKADSIFPVDVVGLGSGVVALSAGAEHTCAVKSGGATVCWGAGSSAQLGNGTTSDSSIPVTVQGLTATAISAGSTSTCAVSTAGGAMCWGANGAGQLGNGGYSLGWVPTSVTGLTSGVKAIAAGYQFACALTTSGAVKCWGWNIMGQLGNGSTASSAVPVNVSGLTSGVATLATGAASWHACAVTNTGGGKCWGNGGMGQLGDYNFAQSTTPVDVSGLTAGVASVTTGAAHTCARMTAGAVKCWGDGSSGQLGNFTGGSGGPIDTASALNATVVSAGQNHTCAAVTNATAKCWGSNAYGQLSDTKSGNLSFSPGTVFE